MSRLGLRSASMKPRLWVPLRGFGTALLLIGANACMPNTSYQRLPNGDLHLVCRDVRLTSCMLPAADACSDYGYDILSGQERREVTGSPPAQNENISSEATVRCRKAVPLLGADPNVPVPSAQLVEASPPEPTDIPPPPEAAPVMPASGAPKCVPGASVPCVTPACSGAQVCANDGARFEACQCSTSAPATPPAPPTAPAAP